MKIHTLGGYSEVGKNMTAIELKDDVIILDCGFYLPAVIALQDKENIPSGDGISEEKGLNEKKLRAAGAIADDTVLDKLGLRKKVRAILIGHAHLDHVGAIPYVGGRYNCSVYGTPFTIAVLKRLLEDEKKKIPNKLEAIKPNSTFFIQGLKKKYKVDFINMTHSTPQTVMIAVHTDEGIVLYANDFKFDNNPILGEKPNYKKLNEIAKKGVKVLIVDSLYSNSDGKTPSEKVARSLLEEVLLTTYTKKAGIFVTTFSSHIARLQSIVDFGKKLNRKIVFVGRSLNKYVSAAIDTGLCNFKKDIQLTSYKNQVKSALKQVNKNKSQYLVVCTGHQGEPGSMLDRIASNEMPIDLAPSDLIVFSSKTIPTEININNRHILETKLRNKRVRIFDNVHVSGHASREDLRDFVQLVRPKNIIPAHGDIKQETGMVDLAKELGYKFGESVHLMQDNQVLKL
ncbi:MAG: RNase J family beta-CASP ribonuclease [Nanoarchaeota archaeon]|nr:RNase J family beta-CASP ribonuclease [Nanoarchaeota archaeon]